MSKINLNIGAKTSSEKMGTEPINKLLLAMSGPALISMVVQCLYNIINSMFVAKINAACLAAVSLAFPLQMIIGALSTGIGVGINSCISRKLGENDTEGASKSATNGLALGLVTVVIFIIFGVLFSGKFMELYSSDPEVIKQGTKYVFVISVFAFGGIFTQLAFSVLQGTGNMVIPMISQIGGAVFNIALCPLFIFVFKMETLGAAVATVIAQALSMLIGFYGVFKTNQDNLPVSFKGFRPDWAIIKDIMVVGIPAALTQATTSIVSGIINKIIASYGTTVIATYGAYSKLSSFSTMPIFGITRGMNPIIGYSYGAKRADRFKQTERLAGIYALVLGVISFLIFYFFPVPLLHLMSATDDMLDIGIVLFRTMSLSMPFVGLSIVMTQIFPPTGKAYISLTSALLRQVGFLLPLTHFLSKQFGLIGVWYGTPAADALNFILVIFANIWFYKKVLPKHCNTPQPSK